MHVDIFCPFFHRRASGLLPCPGYCQRCCSERWGACVFGAVVLWCVPSSVEPLVDCSFSLLPQMSIPPVEEWGKLHELAVNTSLLGSLSRAPGMVVWEHVSLAPCMSRSCTGPSLPWVGGGLSPCHRAPLLWSLFISVFPVIPECSEWNR